MRRVVSARANGREQAPPRTALLAFALLIWALLALAMLSGAQAALAAAPPQGPGSAPAAPVLSTDAPRAFPTVVLAQEHGLLLTGKLGALRGRSAPDLDSMTEAQAEALGELPRRNVFLRGADCDWGGRTSRFGSPVTLTFTLPKALFRKSTLPVFRHDGTAWMRLQQRAVVGAVNTTASATVNRPGRYALLLSTDWQVVDVDGGTLVEYAVIAHPNVWPDPHVIASGTTSDAAVIAATVAISGSTQDQAVSTLRSFDPGAPVQVFTLGRPTTMHRYWCDTSTVGRWFTPGGSPPLYPEEARRVYALPADNTGTNVTLHLVKRKAALVGGLCADMTDEPGFGPWATGGGRQYFGPKVSTYPPPLYDPAMIVTLADVRWVKSDVDAVRW